MEQFYDNVIKIKEKYISQMFSRDIRTPTGTLA